MFRGITPCAGVHHAQHSDRSPAYNRVVHEVERPFLIRRGAGPHPQSGPHTTLALLAPNTQSRFPIHAAFDSALNLRVDDSSWVLRGLEFNFTLCWDRLNWHFSDIQWN
jgi:hypothetical protein